MTVLDDLTRLKDEYDATVASKGQEVVDLLCKGFLERHPEVTAIRWRQYTPYFNDGDACVFGVHGVYIQLDEGSDLIKEGRSSDYGDGFYDDWSLAVEREYTGERPNRVRTVTGPAADLAEDLNNLDSSFGKFQDVLLAVFGDHSTVTVTANGYDVEEYDHD